MSPDERRDYIRRVVDRAPPLTDERRAALRDLLRPAVLAVLATKSPATTPKEAA